MIFSYIYDKLPNIWQDAMSQKVVLAGPFSFTAILRMVKQAYENFRVQENVYQIVNHVKTLEQEFGKFTSEFEMVGKKIGELQNKYDYVNTTRVYQMRKSMEGVKLEGDTSHKQISITEIIE
jgi:DNA recombination protein RmuC